MAEGPQHFSDDVAQARARFLGACDRIGLRVASFPGRAPVPSDGPRVGRASTAIYCDVARLGSPEATNMLVLCSGAGGGAGFAGAGVATGVIAGGLIRDLPRDVSCLLVHAVNPLGPVWPAASEEAAAPGDAAYPPALSADWSDGMLSAAERRFAAYEEAQRFDRERLAGRTLASLAPPAWGAEVLDAIAKAHLTEKRRLLFLDIRTGPGPFAEIERLAPAGPGCGKAEAAERWLGLPLAKGAGALADTAVPVAGGLPLRVRDGACEMASVLLEAGTYSMATLLQASGPSSGRPAGKADGGGVIAAYPREGRWREALWDAAADIICRGFKGLAG